MLTTAVKDGMLQQNPCHVKGAGKGQAPERPVASPDEVLRLAEAVNDRYEVMVLLAAFCSLRFVELAGLRRNRIDLPHRTTRVEEHAVELAGGKVVFGLFALRRGADFSR